MRAIRCSAVEVSLVLSGDLECNTRIAKAFRKLHTKLSALGKRPAVTSSTVLLKNLY